MLKIIKNLSLKENQFILERCAASTHEKNSKILLKTFQVIEKSSLEIDQEN